MTEQEWHEASFDEMRDPWKWSPTAAKSLLNPRMLTLLACACCRSVCHLLGDEQCKRLIDLIEDSVDSPVDEQSFQNVIEGVRTVHGKSRQAYFDLFPEGGVEPYGGWRDLRYRAICAVDCATTAVFLLGANLRSAGYALDRAYSNALRALDCDGPSSDEDARHRLAKTSFAELARDIMGNPFHPRPTIDPYWLRWNESTVPRLAKQISDERRFGDLPILADALEEAGCTNDEILDHCRLPGPHFRGCWLIDLVLNKR